MLWNLRAPLMLRTALITLLLLPQVALRSGAARIGTVREPAHADVARGSVHHLRRSSHSNKRASVGAQRTPRGSSSKRLSPSRTAQSGRSRTMAGRRSTYHSGRPASLHRIRYGHLHQTARFAALTTAPVSRDLNGEPGAGGFGRDSLSARTPAGEAVRNPQAALPSPEAVEASNAPPDSDAAQPEKDASESAAAGNPLSAPPAGPVVPPANTEVAELQVPRVYGRYALRGNHDSLVRQNERSEEESLERIEDDADLQDRIASGALVRVPESPALMVNTALPEDRRYCRPWTADFLTDLSRAHETQFHRPLVVSSAVRTVEYQKRLMRINRNAADAEGDVVSPHLTGATIDIAKSGLSRREMEWMRDHLFAYQTAGVIDVEEEFRQRCFHITVYKNYAPASSVGRPHHAPVPQTVPPDATTATIPDDSSPRNQ